MIAMSAWSVRLAVAAHGMRGWWRGGTARKKGLGGGEVTEVPGDAAREPTGEKDGARGGAARGRAGRPRLLTTRVKKARMDKILSCGSFQPLDVELTVDLAGKKLHRALEKRRH
jgi:hypothetical protein